MTITLEFGLLAPSLAEQLGQHELEIPAPEADASRKAGCANT